VGFATLLAERETTRTPRLRLSSRGGLTPYFQVLCLCHWCASPWGHFVICPLVNNGAGAGARMERELSPMDLAALELLQEMVRL
jgi:hypothetical protein